MTKLKRNAKRLLEMFQCEYNRSLEENFAQVFAESDMLRLFFINEDRACTDGRNIVVDPAKDGLFCDPPALSDTETFLHVDPVFSSDGWNALRMVTRCQTLHECLHILYTTFPDPARNHAACDTPAKRLTMGLISNIIEDAFIENAACSLYDNLEFYLMFFRIARLYAAHPAKGTVEQVFDRGLSEESVARAELLREYLDHMVGFLLYPMIVQEAPVGSLADYVAKTQDYFTRGSLEGDPLKRAGFAQAIFDINADLIPPDEKQIDTRKLRTMLGSLDVAEAQETSIHTHIKPGRSVTITRRLFTLANDGTYLVPDFSTQMQGVLAAYWEEKKSAMRIVAYTGQTYTWQGSDYDSATIHRNIQIEEKRPKISLHMKRAYQNIHGRYLLTIRSYNARFTQLLKARVKVKEDKFLFGAAIASKRMGDVKKRYWTRNVEGLDIPEIAILLLIDGSGSMAGKRQESAMIAALILHEVLKRQAIPHAIVEHRAIFDKPLLQHNILIGFDAKEEEKYNLLTLKAEEGTREGLTLYWAEKYLQRNTSAENKLVIVLSDGVPAHGIEGDGCYLPPVSIKDTANAVRKLSRRSLNIVAVALDDGGGETCYQALRQIYPHTVACSDLRRLTGQLLTLVSKQLAR